jgi:hypothetical protein
MYLRTDADKRLRAYKTGMEAERRFAEIMQRRGWQTIKASEDQNRFEKWDYRLIKEGFDLLVDVKALKAVDRHRERQDKWLWLEFRNNAGKAGWLYSGQADYFAFERLDCFWLMKKQTLQEIAHQLVLPIETDKPEQAHYCFYTRPKRKDLLACIRYKDIASAAKWVGLE